MPIDSGPAPTGTLGTEPTSTSTLGTVPITDAECIKIVQDYDATGKLPLDADAQKVVEAKAITVEDYGPVIYKIYDPVRNVGRFSPAKSLAVTDVLSKILKFDGKM